MKKLLNYYLNNVSRKINYKGEIKMVKDLLTFWFLKGLIGILVFVLLYILKIIFFKWLTK